MRSFVMVQACFAEDYAADQSEKVSPAGHIANMREVRMHAKF
jgi:hypothetical protein